VGGEEGDEESFQVHRKQLTDNSPFFKAALNGQWRESQEGAVPVPEIGARFFATYAAWGYSHTIEPSDFEE